MRKIKLLTIISMFLLLSVVRAMADGSCMSIHVPVTEKIKSSILIVEGEVISKQSYQEREGKADIYTVQDIKVYKYFKGNNVPQTIHVVTRGGQVGL